MTNPFCSQYGICRDPTAPPGHPNNPHNAITQDHFTDGAFLGHFLQNHNCPGRAPAAASSSSAALEPEHHYHIFHNLPHHHAPAAPSPAPSPAAAALAPGGMWVPAGGPYAVLPAADALKLLGSTKDAEKEKKKDEARDERHGPPVHYHQDQHVHLHGRGDRSPPPPPPPPPARPRSPFFERFMQNYEGERMGRGLLDGFGPLERPRNRGRVCPSCQETMERRRGMWYCGDCRLSME